MGVERVLTGRAIFLTGRAIGLTGKGPRSYVIANSRARQTPFPAVHDRRLRPFPRHY